MIQCWQAGLTANRRTLVKILGKEDGPTGDTAQWVRVDDSPMVGAAIPMIERLMDVGIDGRGPLPSAQSVADAALARHHEAELAIDAMVRSHVGFAAANGFVTGMGGLVTVPIALPANVLGFYLVATRLVAGIASSRGHDISKPEVRSAVLLAMVGADADDLLMKASDAGTGRLVNLAAQRLPGPALMAVRKGVMFRLLVRIVKRSPARLGRAGPLAGGLVGAGVDAYLLKRIADHARREFTARTGPVS
jgi:hypothetical protein